MNTSLFTVDFKKFKIVFVISACHMFMSEKCQAMIGENRQLVTNEPVGFEK